MSAPGSSSTPSTGAGAEDKTARDEVIEGLDVAIEEAKRKVESGRVYDCDAEKVRQGWIRVLVYALNTKRQTLKDVDLDDLDDRISALEGGR